MEGSRHFFAVFIPLLIILDPLGNLPLFLLFTRQQSKAEQTRMALTSTIAAAAILIFFALTDDAILAFFGITLPAFQLAGGVIFFIYALQMLSLIPSGLKTSDEEREEGIAKDNVALVPLATPMLAGPGAITAVLAQQQGMVDKPLGVTLLLVTIVAACFTVFWVFYFGNRIQKFLGVGGIRMGTRLMGLLLAVIAVQFMVSGFEQLR